MLEILWRQGEASIKSGIDMYLLSHLLLLTRCPMVAILTYHWVLGVMLGRSNNKKKSLNHDVIMEANIDLGYITETWLGEGEGLNLSSICLPGLVFSIGLRPMHREVVSLWSIRKMFCSLGYTHPATFWARIPSCGAE